jgi:hypothetical protein
MSPSLTMMELYRYQQGSSIEGSRWPEMLRLYSTNFRAVYLLSILPMGGDGWSRANQMNLCPGLSNRSLDGLLPVSQTGHHILCTSQFFGYFPSAPLAISSSAVSL